jgi:hypothetical protein
MSIQIFTKRLSTRLTEEGDLEMSKTRTLLFGALPTRACST